MERPLCRSADLYPVSCIKVRDAHENSVEINKNGRWPEVKRKIYAFFTGGDGEIDKKPKIGNTMSWKALMAKISRLQRLKIFDQGEKFAI